MYKTWVVASNTAHEALRQPLFYILLVSFGGMIWSSQYFTMFTLDESLEAFLLREMGISSIALACGLMAVLLSWLVITREMEKLTALTVLSKPVTRGQFLLGKYFGILGAVAFAAAVLAAALVVTLWQKEGEPRFSSLCDIDEAAQFDWGGDSPGLIESVELSPEYAHTVLVTLDRTYEERTSALARLAGVPQEGRFAGGSLFVWRDSGALEWNVLRSSVRNGKTTLVVQRDWRVVDTAGRAVHVTLPADAQPPIPQAREDARVRPRRYGAAAAHYHQFWTGEAPQILKGATLAVMRVAILLAFAASLAPHASLVANASISFLVFLLGHLSNYLFLALTAPGRGFLSRGFGRIFYALLPNLENFRVESLVAAGRPITMTYVLTCAAYGIAYSALVLVAGTAVFSRKEIR
ncbi:MAG: ABC transporter permease [Planctomycetes bacterium]|nr:ABC transporter permease [Planctomycetota bacterium]